MRIVFVGAGSIDGEIAAKSFWSGSTSACGQVSSPRCAKGGRTSSGDIDGVGDPVGNRSNYSRESPSRTIVDPGSLGNPAQRR